MESPLTMLAPVSGLLEPSEGGIGLPVGPVDPDRPDTKSARYLAGALYIRALHITRQPIDGVVGDADGLFLVLIADKGSSERHTP